MTGLDPAPFRGRLLATLRVQHPDALADGGFRLLHPVTGDRYTGDRRHLVATCRSVANFAVGAVADGPDWCLDAAEHGLAFLGSSHAAGGNTDRDAGCDADGAGGNADAIGNDIADAVAGGYRLVVDPDGNAVDRTRSAYGHAFVLLAHARAAHAGIDGAAAGIEATVDLLDERFHDGTGCLRSDCDSDWTEREPYRGQNANMHACEAYIAAYEATDDRRYLARARRIARRITVDLAAETDGLLWEHYTADWDHDFAYNADDPRHQFRPPGYQPGHHVEWARFLALLDRYDAGDPPDGGWYARAVELFDAAIDLGWIDGGFAYTVEADGDPIVADRYGWALAEGIGAAAALHERATAHGDVDAADRFGTWHARFLDCVDGYRGPAGLWYEKRPAPGDGGGPVAPDPPGVEPDYHPVSAYFETRRSFKKILDNE